MLTAAAVACPRQNVRWVAVVSWKGMQHMSVEVGANPAGERINVGVNAETSAALAELQHRSGLKKVDLVNRAIVAFEYFEAMQREGNQIYVRDENGSVTVIRFF